MCIYTYTHVVITLQLQDDVDQTPRSQAPVEVVCVTKVIGAMIRMRSAVIRRILMHYINSCYKDIQLHNRL